MPPSRRDLEEIRSNVLKNWRVARQPEKKERIAEALDRFIAEVLKKFIEE